MLPLHSRGCPTPSTGSKIRTWLPHPCLLGGPKEGGIATSPRQTPGSPTPSAGGKIRSGYLAPAFYGTQKRVQMLRHLCILGGRQRQARGAKSEVATPPLPSRGPKEGQQCYATPTFSEVPNAKRGEQNQRWMPQALPCPVPKRGRKGYATTVFLGVPNAKRGEQNEKWLPHPCLLGGPQVGANATSPLHSRGSPTPSTGSKIRTRCLTPAYLGPKRGQKCYVTPAFSEVPNAKCGEQHHRWLPHPCLLGGPKQGGNAT